MSKKPKHIQLLNQLEQAEDALQDLLTTLASLNSVLTPIEQDMKVTDFASSGEYVPGASKGIVCILSGLIQGDPLKQLLTEKGRGRNIPALIKAGDRSESIATVESVVNMLHAEDKKQSMEYVINLRWALLPEPLENKNVVILGSRYVSGNQIKMTKLERSLEHLQFKLVKDDGEFGGGPLVYEIIRSFKNRHELLVAELTLSREVVDKEDAVIEILKMLASF